MCKASLYKYIHSYLVGLQAYILTWVFINVPTMYVRAVKAMMSLHICAGSSELSLLAYVISMSVISSKISLASLGS